MTTKGNKILSCLILITIFFGCDKVEEPYIEGNPFSGTYDSDLPIRKILLEDFTGFGCINCPRATEEIHRLQDRYGAHIVPVAIHAGWFARPFAADDPNYTTDIGMELGGDGLETGVFVISSQPIGVINRISNESNNFKLEYETWSAKIVEILSENKFADINIIMKTTYNEGTRQVDLDLSAIGISNIDAKLSLAIYVIENKVIGRQRDGSAVIEDYEHNHMLRGGMNGTWGEEVSTNTPFKTGDKIEKTYNYLLSAEWNANNCDLVAFIYNTETKEVIQAENTPVIAIK